MNLQEIQSIRDELLNRVTEALGGQQGSDNAQGAEPAAARLPFAAGISVRNDKDLALEVRVDPGNTKALKEVEALKKKKPRLLVTIQNFFSSANAVELDPDPHPVLTRKAETLYPGLSIGHKEVRAGTLGAFVKCNDGKAGILTAGHVIGRIGIEDNWGWVYQPGLPDVRIMRARRRIGRVRDFPDLAVANINIIDAGIVEVQKSWVGRITNTIPSLGTPVDGVEIGGAALTIDELQNLGSRPKVWKVGRKTGYTEGRMTAFDVNGVTVDYGGGRLHF